MTELIAWSLTAGGASSSGIGAAGTTTCDATVSVSVDLDAGGAERALTLQVDDVEKVVFLAISCDRLDGSVTVKATAAEASALTGPIVLFGAAVGLFASDLTTLTVHNTSSETAATLSVLVGLNV